MMFQFSKNQVFAVIIAIFIATQLIGLYTAGEYIKYINAGELTPIFDNPNDVGNSFQMVFYILAVTAVFIMVIKYKKSLIRVVEALAIFFTSAIVFDFAFPQVLGLGEVLALILTGWKMFKPTHLKQNVALVISVAGAGAVVGVSFAILPILVFMLLLSVYDFISVFITKHMVYIAKAITETPTAFTAAIPCKKPKHVFQLGGGDLMMPLAFSASVLNYHGPISALFASAGAFATMILLFYFVLKKPGQALPALPPICAGACIGFALSLLL
ncbi:MAG: presenilin family intramembrane aspartyl protease [archaeon]